MNETRYVQHKSGQGEKWEVTEETPFAYVVEHHADIACRYYLPKSEYILCDPPEQWQDVTEKCRVDSSLPHRISDERDRLITENTGYRLRKVPYDLGRARTGWAFIVERKVQP